MIETTVQEISWLRNSDADGHLMISWYIDINAMLILLNKLGILFTVIINCNKAILLSTVYNKHLNKKCAQA